MLIDLRYTDIVLTNYQRGRRLSLETAIPDHGAFPIYAPSFVLDVPPGNVSDGNTTAYLEHISSVFEGVVQVIKNRMVPLVSC
jgi:histone deacetylase 8